MSREGVILVIDNYDSFTYNLVQYLAELGATVEVRRNDEVGTREIAELAPAGILVSPGPGRPEDAGVTQAAIERFAGSIPIFGVCLGHQAIGQVYGGKIVRAERLMHGRVSPVRHKGAGVFEGLPDPLIATRYHSLLVERESLPDELELTAWTDEGEIMGIRHKRLEVEGVQFHPESFLTEHGHDLLGRFVARTRA
jgi:anthranilate synthase/aminodeoxychorismate synthase-like glutamine amidotransferase